jgi:DNA-binding GntR family transcriptional regulator
MKKNAVYLEIEQDIIQDINTQKLKIGDQIMTEEQLCKKYKVSRMTINKAIAGLVSAGFIYRTPGKGSFIKNVRMSKKIGKSSSFTQDMISRGLRPGSKLLEYSVKRGSELPLVAEKLKLGGNDLIHYFVRLRTGDEIPMAISYTYISGTCIPTIDLNCLEKSFYEYVEHTLGLKIATAEGEMTATMPTEEQQKILGIKDEALLLNTHVTCLDNGEPMEYIKTYYIGSRYAYSYTMQHHNNEA